LNLFQRSALLNKCFYKYDTIVSNRGMKSTNMILNWTFEKEQTWPISNTFGFNWYNGHKIEQLPKFVLPNYCPLICTLELYRISLSLVFFKFTRASTSSGIHLFEETKEVFRNRSLWERSKRLNIFYDKGPLYCASVYRSIMQLSRVRTRFVLSEITELWRLQHILIVPSSSSHQSSTVYYRTSRQPILKAMNYVTPVWISLYKVTIQFQPIRGHK
jgi:hypothetical protein